VLGFNLASLERQGRLNYSRHLVSRSSSAIIDDHRR
jgi:hypothetical protein